MPMRRLVVTALLLGAFFGGSLALAREPDSYASKVEAQDLFIKEFAGDPSKKVRSQLYTFPSGAVLPWHIHPDAHEIAYVIEGTFTFERAGEAPKVMKAGDADYVAPKESGVPDWVGAFAVTAGLGIEKKLAEFERAHDDYSAIMLKALADRLADRAPERDLARVEAMVNSMTPRERRHPDVINGSRRKRIARGSGTSVQDVNQLLRQFAQAKRMMKTLKTSRGRNAMARLFSA